MTLSELFGRRVAEVRQSQGMTQRDIAQRLGVSQQAVALCELGKIGSRTGEFGPRLDRIFRYADALGVSPCDLIPEREETP